MAIHYGGRLLRLKCMLIRNNFVHGILWCWDDLVLLINCLGSPFACIYLIVRLTQNRNLSLRDKREYQIISKNEG